MSWSFYGHFMVKRIYCDTNVNNPRSQIQVNSIKQFIAINKSNKFNNISITQNRTIK